VIHQPAISRSGQGLDSYLDLQVRHIAYKLCVRFVQDDPLASLVDGLARTYLENDTGIVPVLRSLFSASEFWSSTSAKLRRPFEMVTALLSVFPGYNPTFLGFA
jgi:uncharacterized protein (DUF1800 family)